MKLREACINHMQKHKERFSKVSIVERVCDVMQVGSIVMMNIGKHCAEGSIKNALLLLFQEHLSRVLLDKVL